MKATGSIVRVSVQARQPQRVIDSHVMMFGFGCFMLLILHSAASANLILNWSDPMARLTGTVHVDTTNPAFMANSSVNLANLGIISISFTDNVAGNVWSTATGDAFNQGSIGLPADPNNIAAYTFTLNTNDTAAVLGNNAQLTVNGTNGSLQANVPGLIISNGTLSMSAVPEPSTVGLALVGVLGLAAISWRRRKDRHRTQQ